MRELNTQEVEVISGAGIIQDALSGLGSIAGGALGNLFGLGSLGNSIGSNIGKNVGGLVEGLLGGLFGGNT